jgi:hypothetical protein
VDGEKRIWLRLVLGFKLVVGAGIRGRVFFYSAVKMVGQLKAV